MRKLLLAGAVLLSAAPAFAQKCKFDKETKDAFSGKEVKQIECDFRRDIKNTLVKTGSEYAMNMEYYVPAMIDRPILTTDTLMFALANGSVVKVAPKETRLPFIK